MCTWCCIPTLGITTPPRHLSLVMDCLRLVLVILCVPILVTSDTEPENKSVVRQLGVLKFEIETLKNAISTKKSVMQDLEACTGRTLRISRNTDAISTYPTARLLRELIKLTELERAMYHNVKLHIQQVFPTSVIVGGPGKSSEMIAVLRLFLRDITNTTVNTHDQELTTSCEDVDIQRPRHELVSNHYMTHQINQSCSGPSYGMVLIPGGSYVLPFHDHYEFCGPDNTLLRRRRFRREPYKIVYYKDTKILVESFTQRTKTIKETNLLGGRDRMFARYTGQESSGLSVYGNNVFIVSKYTHLDVLTGRKSTTIYKGAGRYHYAQMHTLNAEPGSDYGVIAGELVGQLPVLITSSGLTQCKIREARLSESGYVTVNGDVYIAGPGNNRVIIFDKDCRRYDEYIQLPPRNYVQDIVGLGDVLLITLYEAESSLRYIAIYVRGSTTSPFNWD